MEGLLKALHGTGEFAAAGRVGGTSFVATDHMGSRPVYRTADGGLFATRHGPASGGLQPPSTIYLFDGRRSVAYRAEERVRHEASAGGVLAALRNSLKRRIGSRKKVAVSFSGGLDSSLIAWLAAELAEVRLFSVFTETGTDASYAGTAADALGLGWRATRVDDVYALLEGMETRSLCSTPMDMGLAAGFYAVSRAACREGFDILLTGQGADELFGGYRKYLDADPGRLQEVLLQDRRSLSAGLGRDSAAGFEGGCSPSFPYLDVDVVGLADRLSPSVKVAGGRRKVVLREAAAAAGLPDMMAEREKKAFQYSSGINKALRKGRR